MSRFHRSYLPRKNLLFLRSVFLLFAINLHAERPFKEIVDVGGYVKFLQVASFTNLDTITSDNIFHNRLNLRFYPTNNISGALEFRNRIFYGESVKAAPNYGILVDIDNGYVDMSWLLMEKSSIVILSKLDRAWLNWGNENWDVRIGRQRINWGVNLLWNSNDLFNAYSFIDFDYEERPGSDGVRVQRYFGTKAIDIAIVPGKTDDTWIGAAMYRFNKWQYDFQFIGGWYLTDIALGTGWAGSIGGAGFKGEATYFHPRKNFGDTSGVASISISADYVFKNQIYLNGSFLFNSGGFGKNTPLTNNIFTQPLSAKNLMPTKLSTLIQISYPVSPLLNTSAAFMFIPGVNGLFIMPTISYAIEQSWDLSLTGQLFFMEVNNSFSNLSNGLFLRLKWSF